MIGRLATPGLLACGMVCACIVPDRDIDTEVRGNPGAVRIVEATTLAPSLLSGCDPADNKTTANCPQVPTGRRSGLVAARDEGGNILPFCVCPEGTRDLRAIDEFFIYAEDPDRIPKTGEAEPLVAVALLDLDPFTDEPQRFVAYEQQLEPGVTGERFRLDDLDPADLNPSDVDGPLSLLFASEDRFDNGLSRFRFGKNNGDGTDLCNDDNGQPLTGGMHTLQIMVTDRPFFRPPRLDANGDAVIGLDGRPKFGSVQYGMPDIAAGATWSIAEYVFECVVEDPDVAADASVCDCSPAEAP